MNLDWSSFLKGDPFNCISTIWHELKVFSTLPLRACVDTKKIAQPFVIENGSRSLCREAQITNIEIGSDAFFEDQWYTVRNPRQIWDELAVHTKCYLLNGITFYFSKGPLSHFYLCQAWQFFLRQYKLATVVTYKSSIAKTWKCAIM